MIYTLTLNPAIDVHAKSNGLMLGKENHVLLTERCAGGKGINVSKALLSYGIKSKAVTLIPSADDDFSRLLSDTELDICGIDAEGRVRENLTLHDSCGKETRISMQGSLVCHNLVEKLDSVIVGAKYIVLAGSLPQDVDKAELKAMLLKKKSSAAKLVIDSRSFSLEDIRDVSPWLVKPNLEELSHYFGKEIDSSAEAMNFAHQMRELGVENVLVSKGADGAVLACASGAYEKSAPKINAVSTIGAGDSAVAGFIVASMLSSSPDDMLRYSLAFGSAACLEAGTNPPTRVNINKLLSDSID